MNRRCVRAEFNAGRLKGVGARIVVETFDAGKPVFDRQRPSVASDAGPQPEHLQNGRPASLPCEGKKGLLAPPG
jgi:hypothetical protein